MRNFHSAKKTHSYFEGWYLKHIKDGHTLALIPAVHTDRAGNRTASIQLLTDAGAATVQFDGSAFSAKEDSFDVSIGLNRFSEKGIILDIKAGNFSVKGKLTYTPFTRLKGDIMGPFSIVPVMQCSHGVLSLSHRLSGSLIINGERIDFTGGTGYIETDYGSSFPKGYLWTQSMLPGEGCVMVSVASVPVGICAFTGCIAAIFYDGRQYRLGTYSGAKVFRADSRKLIICQGRYRLEADFLEKRAFGLDAPVCGSMSRRVEETLSAPARYRFFDKNVLVFDEISPCASSEFSNVDVLRQKRKKEYFPGN